MKKATLDKAKRNKRDEFYTRMQDIEQELVNYRQHFRGKVVYCNCDDPRSSNFVRFFQQEFSSWGLKKLIATSYQDQQFDLFGDRKPERSVYLEYEGGTPDLKHLLGSGDFRSAECIRFLKEADIVVTNPPFSLFREYIAQLIEHDKQFLIVGNMNATAYKHIFPLFKANAVWYGPSGSSGSVEFRVPDHYLLKASSLRVDDRGNKYISMKCVRWFTNLTHEKRHRDLDLDRTYSPEQYPVYDNYDAIEVSKTRDIPADYPGAMGVPITFFDRYNPDQFEILGLMNSFDLGVPYINGTALYTRVVIRNKHLHSSTD